MVATTFDLFIYTNIDSRTGRELKSTTSTRPGRHGGLRKIIPGGLPPPKDCRPATLIGRNSHKILICGYAEVAGRMCIANVFVWIIYKYIII